jgi:hypothetical protein
VVVVVDVVDVVVVEVVDVVVDAVVVVDGLVVVVLDDEVDEVDDEVDDVVTEVVVGVSSSSPARTAKMINTTATATINTATAHNTGLLSALRSDGGVCVVSVSVASAGTGAVASSPWSTVGSCCVGSSPPGY